MIRQRLLSTFVKAGCTIFLNRNPRARQGGLSTLKCARRRPNAVITCASASPASLASSSFLTKYEVQLRIDLQQPEAVTLTSSRNTALGESIMKGIIARSLGLAVSLAALSTTLLAGPAAKQPEKPQSATPLPTDWSHQHLIFSHPRTPEQAARVQKDIRYQLQQRRLTAHRAIEVPIGDEKIFGSEFQRHHAHRRGRRMHRDWSVDLGPSASTGAARFPAKYSFLSTTVQFGTAFHPQSPTS